MGRARSGATRTHDDDEEHEHRLGPVSQGRTETSSAGPTIVATTSRGPSAKTMQREITFRWPKRAQDPKPPPPPHSAFYYLPPRNRLAHHLLLFTLSLGLVLCLATLASEAQAETAPDETSSKTPIELRRTQETADNADSREEKREQRVRMFHERLLRNRQKAEQTLRNLIERTSALKQMGPHLAQTGTQASHLSMAHRQHATTSRAVQRNPHHRHESNRVAGSVQSRAHRRAATSSHRFATGGNLGKSPWPEGPLVGGLLMHDPAFWEEEEDDDEDVDSEQDDLDEDLEDLAEEEDEEEDEDDDEGGVARDNGPDDEDEQGDESSQGDQLNRLDADAVGAQTRYRNLMMAKRHQHPAGDQHEPYRHEQSPPSGGPRHHSPPGGEARPVRRWPIGPDRNRQSHHQHQRPNQGSRPHHRQQQQQMENPKQDEQREQRAHRVPYHQSPVVVSISDNSFVSASPPVSFSARRQEHLHNNNNNNQQHREFSNRIDQLGRAAEDVDGDEDDGLASYTHLVSNITTSTTATTTSNNNNNIDSNSNSFYRIDGTAPNVIVASGEFSQINNSRNTNRVETSTRGEQGSDIHSDPDDVRSRYSNNNNNKQYNQQKQQQHRKVHLSRPLLDLGHSFTQFEDHFTRRPGREPTDRPEEEQLNEDNKIHSGVQSSRDDRTEHFRHEPRAYFHPDAHGSPVLVASGQMASFDHQLTTVSSGTTTMQAAMPSESDEESEINNDIRAAASEADDEDDRDEDEDDAADDEDDSSNLDDETDLSMNSVVMRQQQKSSASRQADSPVRYSHIIAGPRNELPSYGPKYWHNPHKASIQLIQEEPNDFHHGGYNSALIAILFGIGATGMLIMIVSVKMRTIRERVAYKGRRRSLVPDTDFLINTIPI